MRAGQPKMPECSSVGAKFVGRQQFRHKALFPEQLAHQPECRPLVAAALNQHVENLGLVINRPPQVHPFAGNPDDHLVEVPYVDGPLLARNFGRFRSDRLRSYVRPFAALARERWPRWFPRPEFLTSMRPKTVTGTFGMSRVLDRLITPSTRHLASSGIGSGCSSWVAFRPWLMSRRCPPRRRVGVSRRRFRL